MNELSPVEVISTELPETQSLEDEMYWVTFRYLTLTRQYEPVTIEDLFKYLKKNHVLSETDTPESVYAEVLGWSRTIEADALEKNRQGKIIYLPEEDSISFAATSAELAAESVKLRIKKLSTRAVKQVIPKPTATPDNETPQPIEAVGTAETSPLPHINPPTEDELLIGVEAALDKEGLVRQQAIKNSFIPEGVDDVTRQRLQDAIQTVIDGLVEKGVLSKVARNNVRWLSFNPSVPAIEKDSPKTINPEIAVLIFNALSNRGLHWQQRFTIKELWANISIGVAIGKDDEILLKQQCRLLADIGVLEAGEAKLKSRSSALSRAASQRVFKVGFQSQAMKEAALRACSDGDLLIQLLEATAANSSAAATRRS